MVVALVRGAIFIGSCAIGLLITMLTVDGFTIDVGSFVLTAVVFGALQAILSPFIAKTAARHASALLGGVGLISTFVALFITSLLLPGLRISGFSTWVISCLVVWIVTMIATLLLPLFVGKKILRSRSGNGTSA